jgi:hypothetical protein
LSSAQNTLSGQAQKAIFKLNKYLHKFTYIPPKHKLDLFDKLVSPILNYCSEICGFANDASIETIHMQFCKQILGVKKTTQNDFIYGELGRISFKTIHHYNIIKYWTRILDMPNNKYVSLIYNMLKHDMVTAPNKVNWCSLVKDLLSSLGFYDVWLQQHTGNNKLFLIKVKQRLKDQFIQNWHNRITNSSRALFYKNIACFKFQPYLDYFTINKFCQSLCKLRVSSHRLHIESGRWTKPIRTPINERTCQICNLLEDEFHFIIECPLYSELRTKYISSRYTNRPNMFKFLELINSENKTIITKLGIFLEKAFRVRNEFIYGN